MQHAITIGDLVWPLLAIFGLLGLGGLCIFIVYILNPFRSGH